MGCARHLIKTPNEEISFRRMVFSKEVQRLVEKEHCWLVVDQHLTAHAQLALLFWRPIFGQKHRRKGPAKQDGGKFSPRCVQVSPPL